MRRRRAMTMVAALFMAAAIRPRPVFVKAPKASDRRIPRRRHHPVAVAVLFEIGEPGERIVEALQLQLLGGHHVVDPAARLLGHVTVLIEERMPTRVTGERSRIVGYIRLDEHLAGAG